MPDAEVLVWRSPVPSGLSSPVLAGDLVVLTGVEEGRLVTIAYERETGRPIWRSEAPEGPLERVHETSSPAASTPLALDGRIHVYFGSHGLFCYDFDGQELWRLKLPAPKSLYGMATSPVAHGENLILVLDNEENLEGSTLSQSRILAVDRATGQVVWETPRPLVRSGWSTPAIWRRSDREELVVLGSGRVSGYDPASGHELWHATGFSQETIAQPVVGEGVVFVSSAQLGGGADERLDPRPLWDSVLTFDANGDGRLQPEEMTGHFTFPLRPELSPGHPGYGIPLPRDPAARQQRLESLFGGVDKNKDRQWTYEEFAETVANRPGKPRLLAIRAGGSGDITSSHSAWELTRHIPEIPTPLYYQGRLYLVRNGGMLTCVQATTGSTHYNERLDAPGQYSASPVAADGHMFLLSNRGLLTVVKAGSDFSPKHRHDLGEPVFVTPAIDHDTLYIRGAHHLFAFRRVR